MIQGKRIPDDFWNKDFLEALKMSMGNVMMACKGLNISPPSYYNHRLKHPSFAKKADSIIERVCVPVLEDTAFLKAMKGDTRLLIFLLRTRGGKKWNQDLIEAAFAKDEAFYLRRERDSKTDEEQRMPTKAERAAAKAYLEALEGEDDEEEASGAPVKKR